jgi:hypothetical protein
VYCFFEGDTVENKSDYKWGYTLVVSFTGHQPVNFGEFGLMDFFLPKNPMLIKLKLDLS